MRRVAMAAAALFVLLSLTGCSRLFVQHDIAEDPLREQIADLASVVEVASSVDNTFGATVWVLVSDLIESDLQAIVASADELLAGRDVTLKITLDQHNLLLIGYPLEYSAEELASEVDYWLALSAANDAPLGIMLQEGPRRNIWDPDKSNSVDWDALRAVPDPSTADLSWYLDGFVAKRTMPTADVVALRDRLGAIELGENETLTVDYFTPGFTQIRYVSPEAGLSDPTTAANWPRVQEIVSQLAALGLPQSNFVFNVHGFAKGASLHLGECAELEAEDSNWMSDELVAALTSTAMDFPVGVSAGFCNDGHV